MTTSITIWLIGWLFFCGITKATYNKTKNTPDEEPLNLYIIIVISAILAWPFWLGHDYEIMKGASK